MLETIIKILITDDNASDIFLFTEAVESVQQYLIDKDINLRLKVDKAFNGDESLNFVKHTEYDIIFLDIKMPKMSGIEVLSEIKKLNLKSKVVMFTTSDYEKDVLTSFNLKADGYILKSLDMNEFEENLKAVLLVYINDNFIFINSINNKFKNTLK